MRSKFARWTTAALAAAALLATPACDRDTNDDDHGGLASLEVIDRGETGQPVVATWTIEGGWEGTLPVIDLASENQRIVLGVAAYDDDGHEIALSETGPTSVRYAVAQGAPQGVLDMTHDDHDLFHGDHVYLYGAEAGTTQVRFLLWHGDHADDQTGTIDVTVVGGL